MEKVRKAAAVYFVLQCVGVVAWFTLHFSVGILVEHASRSLLTRVRPARKGRTDILT